MWHKQWGVDLAIQELQWPDDLGDELPAIVTEEICDAAKTFPRMKRDLAGIDGIRRWFADFRRSCCSYLS